MWARSGRWRRSRRGSRLRQRVRPKGRWVWRWYHINDFYIVIIIVNGYDFGLPLILSRDWGSDNIWSWNRQLDFFSEWDNPPFSWKQTWQVRFEWMSQWRGGFQSGWSSGENCACQRTYQFQLFQWKSPNQLILGWYLKCHRSLEPFERNCQNNNGTEEWSSQYVYLRSTLILRNVLSINQEIYLAGFLDETLSHDSRLEDVALRHR